MNVLVVDDEDDLRTVTTMFLEMRGHRAIQARSGEEALEMLERDRPDVVLLDLRMAGIGGWAVIEALRVRQLLDTVPVIVVSAHADSATAQRAMDLGCRAYLAKPFTAGELVAALLEATNGGATAGG